VSLLACASAARAQNPVVTENALAGNPSSQWDVSGAGDASIQGFATEISVNKGETVRFKIKTNAAAYHINVYRLGYYGGSGARLQGTGVITAALPQSQPAPLADAATGLVDCGNWAESAHWDVPANAVSGLYLARLVRNDTNGASHIAFVVRDDARPSDLLFKAADATWQAYNVYGGNSLYLGSTSYVSGHAVKVSYNRPFSTRAGGGGSGEPAQDWLFNAEYPMIRWLEANGYDVTYSTDVDADRRGALLLNHRVFLSVGHDEYWSGAERANVEAARDAGVHLGFFSGNEVYWKTRWEPGTDASATPYRTLVCYKEGTLGENVCGGKCDPLPGTWTGLWRDGCAFTPPADGCRPENALSGQISWYDVNGAITVPSTFKALRLWRNTSVATLANGATATFPANTLGYEWDFEQYADQYPQGRILLSQTTVNGRTHQLSLHRAASGALVFGAGTVQWSWGLDSHHDRGTSTTSTAMQQATLNLLADMGAQPATRQAGLVAATTSTDVMAPVSVIGSPAAGAALNLGEPLTVSGTASDVGGVVAGVDISVDGGASWQPASGRTSWTYAWTPQVAGPVTIVVRAFDDSGNREAAGTGPASNVVAVTIVQPTITCPCTLFPASAVPGTPAINDGRALELGLKFRAAQDGWIEGIRFYKAAANTGVHTGELYAANGSRLAQSVFTGGTGSGWQQVAFASRVPVTAGTTYVAALHSASGWYALDALYFSTAAVRGLLRGLADGEDGANGTYLYTASPAFPTNTDLSSNYWVDVVYEPGDITPPAVTGTTPAAGATGIATSATISAVFGEALDSTTVTTATFRLLGPGGVPVPADVRYDGAIPGAVLTPLAPLADSTTYTAWLAGGVSAPRIADLAGNALAADVQWTFTTAAPAVTGVADAPVGALRLRVAPNPVAGPLRFGIESPLGGRVSLELLDATGRLVRRLADAAHAAGRWSVACDAHDDAGRPLPPGLYLARLRADARTVVARIVVLR
jgi:hypothetical protein